jgi:hypothetical protein
LCLLHTFCSHLPCFLAPFFSLLVYLSFHASLPLCFLPLQPAVVIILAIYFVTVTMCHSVCCCCKKNSCSCGCHDRRKAGGKKKRSNKRCALSIYILSTLVFSYGAIPGGLSVDKGGKDGGGTKKIKHSFSLVLRCPSIYLFPSYILSSSLFL